jgi:hypothetical protein
MLWANPTVQQRYAEMGLELPSREQRTPEALGVYHKTEIAKRHNRARHCRAADERDELASPPC